MESPAPTADPKAPVRIVSIDAYRGLVMMLMAGEALRFHAMARNLPGSGFWAFLAHHQEHAPWRGCTLHDLIQPSFSFLVGVALPWSVARRRGDGQSWGRMCIHTWWRAFALAALGIVLRSIDRPRLNFTFEDTLTQIGLGYGVLWMLAWARVRTQVIALGAVLAGYWLLFALWPAPPPGFDPATVGVPADWAHRLSGFAAHWDKNMNPAHAFDVWFLNQFPRETPFTFNSGGYLTLSFIPTLGTMLLGLLAGQWLRRDDLQPARRVAGLVGAGLAGLAIGSVLDLTGICPSVKRIWTPSWVLFSGGWCCLFLAAFHALADLGGRFRWVLPLTIVGMNSIFMYVIAHLWDGFFRSLLGTVIGPATWPGLVGAYAPVVEGAFVLLLLWACCAWLWRKRVFIRI